jgi:GH24 family phage-related lysozyme (muramidase)
VTIGIGYDLGYCTPSDLADDWRNLLTSSVIGRLAAVCGKKGDNARFLPSFYTDIRVNWNSAGAQLNSFLKLVAGQVINAFPGSEQLTADSFGALVSLAYNRGTAMHSQPGDALDRRREMSAVRDLIQQGKLSEVSGQIKEMKRIWKNDRDAAGLLSRRDAEASLFEVGL